MALHRSIGRIGCYGLDRVRRGQILLHRLTRAIVRDHIPAGQVDAYRAGAEALLVAAGLGNPHDHLSWPAWALLLPHLLATDPAHSLSPGLRKLAYRALWYLHRRGDDRTARDLAEQLYQNWRERLGPDHRHTLKAAAGLAVALANLVHFDQARTLAEDTLARSAGCSARTSPDTLAIGNMLAGCLYELGRFDDSRKLNEDILHRARRVLGHDDPRTLDAAQDLAGALSALGMAEQARQLSEDTLARRRRTQGHDHPTTLQAANNHATALRELGQTHAAHQLITDTLTHTRRILGDNHPQTLCAAITLAECLRDLGEFEAARRQDADTLPRCQRILGDNHPLTRASAKGLAADLAERRQEHPTIADDRIVPKE